MKSWNPHLIASFRSVPIFYIQTIVSPVQGRDAMSKSFKSTVTLHRHP